ncbi:MULTISPECIES: adenylosuccinate lyase [unclassified Roseivivax]|uniref:adenylosuccinate lyase n=1 Tax=Roseivivax sp. GX 12232 TaxID=2900547 RepID=UPI001E5E587F|nr:adenylosuccinate lyase [Roseivivax sp. GX 12232]MCE0504559.1 adenylosuccinate lyase [Roseivivax sp. GX 12232]
MIKTAFAAFALTVCSTLTAYAACGHGQASITCAEGTVYDAASQSCKVVTG